MIDVTQKGSISFSKDSLHISHRLVARIGSNDSDEIRLDDITVQSDDEDEDFPQEKFIFIRIRKALALVRFDGDDGIIRPNVNTTRETRIDVESVSEYIFVQYYKVLTRRMEALYKIYKVHDCVWFT